MDLFWPEGELALDIRENLTELRATSPLSPSNFLVSSTHALSEIAPGLFSLDCVCVCVCVCAYVCTHAHQAIHSSPPPCKIPLVSSLSLQPCSLRPLSVSFPNASS